MSKAIVKKTIERVFIKIHIHHKYNKIGAITNITAPI